MQIPNIIKTLIQKYKIYIKYLISGSTGAFVNLSSLYLLTEFAGFHYIASAIIAFFISLSISFNLQKKWTFRNGETEVARQVSIYLAITLSNLFINMFLLYILVDVFHIWYMLAQVGIYGFIAVYSFVLYRVIVFK
ncbi:MAG: hypothetical protein US83_C0015G0011 [Candidatus Falkowbacteria bacterium GW2011_GWC2_38_22]|nr:MAG: hypothetical protein US73_C0013G0011 [Candidatus Falkowbacteria bacterium GW2011_GWF2_38_1205]KKQ60603.1 MAG: hypothetical protein US83_C0015G0011 [Candidatus Falkowbacteria bacterium GW2011_GWC2_38_22]KKQ62694.1 MAG: hypothetical protein US84_C0012G0011 [Candidatus Falkowbacteria bacterium GW2011_GWF1_38_22]KKQ64821.1 MAG: hypothetical protein US87_C0012G0011 [Candidatus Falkowbacteria bacterium GW2011_GWE2_38_254]KKQ72063.1 MAG: hypothetical protein US93_C0012G0011 [Candidatus Falkowb